MKHLKMLGLAAIAALGLVAFVGTGTASATTLFTNISQTVRYGAGTEFRASLQNLGSVRFANGGGETVATCTGSSLAGVTSNETGTSITGSLGTLTWSECSTTTDTVSKGQFEIRWSEGLTGEVIGSSNEVTLSLFGVSCTYGTFGTRLGFLSSGLEPIVEIQATLLKTAGGFLCPSVVYWYAKYVVTNPHALFVGA